MKASAITAATIRVCGVRWTLMVLSAATDSSALLMPRFFHGRPPVRARGEAIQIVLVNLHDDCDRDTSQTAAVDAPDRDAPLADRRLRDRQPDHGRRRLSVRRQPAGTGR